MNAAEIIRNLANVVDKVAAAPEQDNAQAIQVDNKDDTEITVMVPPLQQKLELMKKAAGVDNIYDQGDTDVDPLNQIKKNAGLDTQIVVGGESNDIEG